jgi:hypothetical protein
MHQPDQEASRPEQRGHSAWPRAACQKFFR